MNSPGLKSLGVARDAGSRLPSVPDCLELVLRESSTLIDAVLDGLARSADPTQQLKKKIQFGPLAKAAIEELLDHRAAVQPADGAQVPGIRKWPEAYLPKIYNRAGVDRILEVTQADAEEYMRRLAKEEGIFAGVSSGGGLWAALQISKEVQNAVIVHIVCDRGDRYLSTGVFPA